MERRSYRRIMALLMLFCLLLTACSSGPVQIKLSSDGTTTTTNNTNTTSDSQSAGSNTGGVQGVQLYVEPDDGEGVITGAINNAQKSVWLEMYLLSDRNVINALEDAAHRNVAVRVMLEGHPYGGGSLSPSETIAKLNTTGVKAKTTNPSFALTHEKGMVIDGKTAYIMTSNFTLSALGGSKSTRNREYGIIDGNPQDVQAVQDIFQADWNRQTPQINNTNLVVSPINSRARITTLINSAHTSLLVEAEEMQDSGLEQALIAARKRGVTVQVILPVGKSNDSNAAGARTIKRYGIQVKQDAKLYMHAKIFVVDGQSAFIGSENISTASLQRNRELGIIVADAAVLNRLQQTFQQDWSISRAA